ncbi:MAG: 3-hydroxyacyl-ACP dehydratase FabZ [Desulfobacterales bacterium]|nr:3-hydroxyacyl-ACP dehydratase FabZ [Desulfobacterales bacterium]
MVDTEEYMRTMGKILPHRYPFLMIDRVMELEPGRRAVAVKAVSLDDFFLAGHVPRNPCLPEALIVEALAQTGGLAMLSAKEGGMGILVKVEEMQFTKTIRPGDLLTLFAEVEFSFGKMAKVKVRAESEGKTVAQGILVLAQGKP